MLPVLQWLGNTYDFYPCDAMLRHFRMSVCLCVTRVLCIKMAKHFVEILSPPDSPIILSFRHRGSLLNSDSFAPKGGAKYKGVRKLGDF